MPLMSSKRMNRFCGFQLYDTAAGLNLFGIARILIHECVYIDKIVDMQGFCMIQWATAVGLVCPFLSLKF